MTSGKPITEAQRLSSVSCQVQIGALQLDGQNACEHFRVTREVPAIGSPAWTVLAQIVELLGSDAQARAIEIEKQAAAAEAQLDELRKQRADKVATVGVQPLTTD